MMKTAVLTVLFIVAFVVTVEARGEIKDANFRLACGEVIRAFGYQCPRAAIVWDKGLKRRGRAIKVICGEKGSDRAYPDLTYRIYMDPRTGEFISLEPWD